MTSSDKNWAKQYVLDPLTAPEPADETGPGASLRVEPIPQSSRTSTPPSAGSANPFRQNHGSPKETLTTSSREISSSSQPLAQSPSSPRRAAGPPSYRQESLGSHSHRRRSSSLKEKFPGDMSHRPLDQLAKEKAVADRARHATKKHHIAPDQVDLLDGAAAGGAYHHGGPYDATLLARNNSYLSPLQAVADTNNETIRATPREKLIDSLDKHRPLDGVAAYAPGDTDPNGHTYKYEAGDNMMLANDPEGGAYKRWPGIQYHPDDIKGKGEPSYTIEKALKDHKISDESAATRKASEQGIEMSGWDDGEEQMRRQQRSSSEVNRSDSTSKRLSGGLKKRIGSLKKHLRPEELLP